jgi:hypothetical protein
MGLSLVSGSGCKASGNYQESAGTQKGTDFFIFLTALAIGHFCHATATCHRFNGAFFLQFQQL